MDKTDIVLCQLLLGNSRLSYSELADKLNLSVTAIHKRIQDLIESRVIRKFTTKISLFQLDALHIVVFGRSKLNSVQNLPEKLESNSLIYWLSVGGGNYLYIGAYLQSIGELDTLISFLKEMAKMPEPTVGISTFPMPLGILPELKNRTLYPLDYQIIGSLKNNSRKATSEVANELRVSAKTVRRRLARMMKDRLVELSMEWYPDASNDIISLIHVHLKPQADKNTMAKLFQKYAPNIVFYWGFSNLPNVFIMMFWTSSMKDLQGIRESLEKEADLQSVAPNVLYTGYIFETWRDQLLEEKAGLSLS
jgi:DNA-binding Lrp family transcriptional regulator